MVSDRPRNLSIYGQTLYHRAIVAPYYQLCFNKIFQLFLWIACLLDPGAIMQRIVFTIETDSLDQIRISQLGPSAPLGGHEAVLRGPRSGSPGATERFSGGHEQRPLLNSSAVILQNPVDEQRVTSVESFWKGATNREGLDELRENLCKNWKRSIFHNFWRVTTKRNAFLVKPWKLHLMKIPHVSEDTYLGLGESRKRRLRSPLEQIAQPARSSAFHQGI